jgi:hypothetical protein
MSGNAIGQATVISQRLLAAIFEHKRAMDQADERYQATRRKLLELHNAGAAMEPGRFGCQITSSQPRRLNARNLGPILGEEEVARLQALVPTILQHYVTVFDSESLDVAPDSIGD